MAANQIHLAHNGVAFAADYCPLLPVDLFRQTVLDQVGSGARLAALFGRGVGASATRLYAVLTRAEQGDLAVTATEVEDCYPALTPECPQAHWFEREIAEQWGVRPSDHPWLKPIRFQPPRVEKGSGPICRNGPEGAPHKLDLTPFPLPRRGSAQASGVTDFFQMDGEEVHEVAVGPVHAGIIEPGHFRFQCHGETVYHLEISLGYQHRGIERAVLAGPAKRILPYMETLAGDTTVGHATAYCRATEGLSKTRVPARAQVIRGVAMELERVANHIGDLGALAGDVGFLPTMSYCGRIRGDVLNLTAAICGNRFGRGLICPGGAAVDIDPATAEQLCRRLGRIDHDAKVAIELLWNAPSVTARFDQIGVVPRAICREIGLVGVAARACGLQQDVRRDSPYGIFRFTHIPVSTWDTCDVFARAYVRWLEIQRSLAFIGEQLQSLPEGAICEPPGPLLPNAMIVALVEGWRGEICHVAASGSDGRLAGYKIVDPSFHNWFGLAYALRQGQVSDFPLCNKSFNLSYCGHDL